MDQAIARILHPLTTPVVYGHGRVPNAAWGWADQACEGASPDPPEMEPAAAAR